MEEAFLHFIWKFQLFNKTGLKTLNDENIEILKTGTHNWNAGPDFLNARILIGGIEWVGHIEIHFKSSDWYKHNHDKDPTYDNVILHVILEDDVKVYRKDGSELPCLILAEKIDFMLYENYKDLIASISPVPCSYKLPDTPSGIKYSMLDKALFQRLENKGNMVLELLRENNYDWEETAYQYLGRNFGFKINSDAFFELTKALPYKILKKHSDSLLQVEALLFGVANLIPESPEDEYSRLLKREYSFLSHKYNLQGNEINKGRWKFLRLRPANFPTVRISQFAAILASVKNLFSSLIEADDVKSVYKLFDATPSVYWQYHYNFGKASSYLNKGIGENSIENLVINTICPLLSAYRLNRDELKWIEKAVALLENTKAEINRITKLFGKSAFQIKNAFDSQAVIELHNNFCSPRKCLECSIGASILRGAKSMADL